MRISKIEFTAKNDGTKLSFTNPAQAIEEFTAKGYGMHNWSIVVTFNDYYNSTSEISLLMFNYISDWWPMEG